MGRALNPLRIAPLRPDQNEAARAVIFAVAFEFFGDGEEFETWKSRVRQTWLARDVDNLTAHYGGENGAFWVLLNKGEVVGTCGVRRLEEGVCELKRMYLLPRVRGFGGGRQLAQTAIEWARGAGFKVMRLDSDHVLVAALSLYRSLGFVPIPRYNEGGADLFFELRL